MRMREGVDRVVEMTTPVTPRARLCTIAASNYLSSVELLVESFSRHHPDVAVTVLIVDGAPGESYADLAFEVVHPGVLALDPAELARMATYYDVTELSTALKPYLLEHLLDRGDKVVMYLDPDIEVFAPLDDLFARAAHGVVLTPHVTRPVPRDGLGVAEEAILLSGQFNLGFVAVGTESRPFLEYWKERTLRHAVCEVASGYFTDQRWIDAVPVLFPHVVIDDLGCNVAYWNLHERPLARTSQGWTAGGVPLRFFHFSGHRAHAPFVLSHHLGGAARVRVDREPPLQQMLHERATRLLARDGERSPSPYRFDRSPGGLRLEPLLRRLYWRAVLDADAASATWPPSAFDPDDGRAFVEWLREPERPQGRVPRHLAATWAVRGDLQHAFPDIDGDGGDALSDWASIDEKQLSVTPAALLDVGRVMGLPGVNLVGYLHGQFGVGAASRLVGSIVRASGLPLATSVLHADGHRHGASFAGGVQGSPFSLSLLAMNADALIEFAKTPDYAALADTRRVGIWYWEVGAFPEELHGAFDLVDEIWCASDYVRDALQPCTDVPVHVHPVPFSTHVPTALRRCDVGLPDDRFVVGFVFDYASVVRRKNPAGVIDAYCRAFAPGDGAELVIKTLNSAVAPSESAELRHRAADRSDIRFLERHFDGHEMAAFYEHLDVYVSLHRSEGLGLTMSSAMAAGVPVVATGWSGNRSFMTADNACLVPYELVPVGPGSPPYPAEACWAEPDIDAAASHLRRLHDDPVAARALGERGRRAITRHGDRRRAVDWFVARFESLTGVAA
jgi:glycosyltransferase involved in cell wall biosynthesis